MTDRDALLAAILADPADDTVRLAFADWCDENGDADRAEFIRLQIQLARRPEPGSEADTLSRFMPNLDAIVWDQLNPILAERANWRKRADALLKANKNRWFGWSDDPEFLVQEVARGFPDWAGTSVFDQFRNSFESIRSEPISRLTLRLISVEEADELTRAEILSRLSSLRLDIRGDEVDAAEILTRLAASGQVGGVTELQVVCRDDDPEPVVRAFAEGRGWGDIRRLELGYWPHAVVWLTDELLAVLVAAPHLRRVTELTLDAELGAGAVATLAKAYPTLESLSIRGVTPNAALTLAHSDLPELRSLRLDVTPDVHEATGMNNSYAIASLLTTPRLPQLAVFPHGDHRPNLTGMGAYLTGPWRGPTLRYLNLRYSGLGPDDATAVVQCPAIRGLIYLELEGNLIESVGVTALAEVEWRRLACLKLHSCGIREIGAVALAGATFPELQRLDLAFNPLGPDGCRALAHGRFPRLRELDVRNCGADEEAAAELRARFGDRVRF